MYKLKDTIPRLHSVDYELAGMIGRLHYPEIRPFYSIIKVH